MEAEGTVIAGYPLVRMLRRTAQREVWVAADASGQGVEVHRSVPGEEAVLAREAEALLLADHPHLLGVLDVATDDGAVLVRPLVSDDLAAWLVARGQPEPGEAVTALVPIAEAIAALHAVGAGAGAVSAHAVRLDADGAPLLTGEGASVETERATEAWRESSDAVAADVAGWRALALLLADASGRALPDAVESALERRDMAAAGAALLAAWPALPLGVDARAPARGTVRGGMRPRERATGVEAVLARLALLLERLPRLREAIAPRPPARAAGPTQLGPSSTAASRLRAAVRAVRPRYWAAGAAGALALVAAAVMLGGVDAAGADAAREQARTDAAAPGVTDPGDARAPEPPATSTPAATRPAPGDASASAPTDDPVAGAAALLAEREACLDAGDAACLVALHEPGSPQLGAERPWRMPDDATLEPVQQLGEAWLLRVASNSEPASVLVMSTEAGWLLRDAWSG